MMVRMVRTAGLRVVGGRRSRRCAGAEVPGRGCGWEGMRCGGRGKVGVGAKGVSMALGAGGVAWGMRGAAAEVPSRGLDWGTMRCRVGERWRAGFGNGGRWGLGLAHALKPCMQRFVQHIIHMIMNLYISRLLLEINTTNLYMSILLLKINAK